MKWKKEIARRTGIEIPDGTRRDIFPLFAAVAIFVSVPDLRRALD